MNDIAGKNNKIIIEENPPAIHIWSQGKRKLSTGIPPAFIETESSRYSVTSIKSRSKTENTEKIIWNTGREDFYVILTVTVSEHFVDFLWEGTSAILAVTFDMSSDHYWCGQGEFLRHEWPLNKTALPFGPLITSDNGPTGLGNIQTPLWWNSDGAGIYVKDCNSIYAGIEPYKILIVGTESKSLKIRVFTGETIRESYSYFIKEGGTPSRIPPKGLLSLPVWTTWAFYKTDITQEQVLTFAKDIRNHSFPAGTVEIDDMWQADYGDFDFNPHKFPAPEVMIEKLHDMDFRVTLWITPFFNPSSKNFAVGSENGFFIKGKDGAPERIPWWHGPGALLDVRNKEAMAWFKEKLEKLQRIGIDGFKFDAGEASFLSETTFPGRNDYSRLWVEFASLNFPYGEVRTGWNNHTSGMLFRQWDKFSVWDSYNGLSSVIPQALTMSLTGYPFILPDIIGGNFYGEEKIERELMIRWTEVSSLMPAMQFGFPPWLFDEETEKICRFYAELHETFSREIIKLAEEAVLTGMPVIRPLFWADPYDKNTYDISDQFLLGNKYLVAPVLKPGSEKRNIYLPAGLWRDYRTGREYEGPVLLSDYSVPLDCLPIFENINEYL